MFHVKHLDKKHFFQPLFIILTAILCCAASVFAQSCANVHMPVDNSEPNSVDTAAEDIRNQIPKTIEFAGQKMLILADREDRILYDDSEIGSVKSAVQYRNEYISSHYQITIEVQTIAEESVAETLKDESLAGLPAAHAICYPAKTCDALLAAGLLTDINALPNFDTSVCYDGDLSSVSTSVGQSLYLIGTDSIPHYNDIYCIYYRPSLIESLGLLSPVDLVKRNEWNLKAFQNYSEQIASAVMKKSSYDVATDRFGYSARTRNLLVASLCDGAGIQTISKTDSNIPVLRSAGELEADVASVRALLKSKSRAPYYGGDASDAFLEGRICFYIDKLSYIDVLYEKKMTEESGFDYGILPLPCGQDNLYHTPIDADAPILCVPKNTPSRELSGLGVMLLVGAGRITVKQAAIDSFLAIYSFGNDESCMLDVILRNTAFSFGNVYGAGLQAVYDGAAGLLYQAAERGNALESLLKNAGEAFDECIRTNFS